jgi:hypothetical protein
LIPDQPGAEEDLYEDHKEQPASPQNARKRWSGPKPEADVESDSSPGADASDSDDEALKDSELYPDDKLSRSSHQDRSGKRSDPDEDDARRGETLYRRRAESSSGSQQPPKRLKHQAKRRGSGFVESGSPVQDDRNLVHTETWLMNDDGKGTSKGPSNRDGKSKPGGGSDAGSRGAVSGKPSFRWEIDSQADIQTAARRTLIIWRVVESVPDALRTIRVTLKRTMTISTTRTLLLPAPA